MNNVKPWGPGDFMSVFRGSFRECTGVLIKRPDPGEPGEWWTVMLSTGKILRCSTLSLTRLLPREWE